MKKIIIFIFLLALIFTSCAPDSAGEQTDPAAGETPANTEAAPEEPTEAALSFPELPEIDFTGYEFRILNSKDGSITWLWTQLTSAEETGEVLNDAIFRRNRRMEAKFGFELLQIDAADPGDVFNKAQRSIKAGGDDYDLAMTTPGNALTLAQTGLIASIDAIPHIDLAAPWWDQNMNRDFSIGNKLFFTSGDFSFNQYSATITILFNKQMYTDLALDDPYQLVRDGKWTVDKFGEMGRAALKDLDGNGVYDADDQWGYMAFSHVYTLAFMNGMGARYIQKDENDMPYLTTNTEHFISRFHAMFDVLQEGWLFDGNTRGMGRPEHIFLENRALFWTELMNWANTLRAMENDFGILPIPKYDEQQPYHIAATGLPHVMCIPVTTENQERTGVILEALNAESRLTTLTVYYDTMLLNQVARDVESGEMLEIIFANKVYETGRMFWEGNIAGPISGAMANGNRDIVSIIDKNEPKANNDIQKAIDAFEK